MFGGKAEPRRDPHHERGENTATPYVGVHAAAVTSHREVTVVKKSGWRARGLSPQTKVQYNLYQIQHQPELV
jgi:hypothetical protein